MGLSRTPFKPISKETFSHKTLKCSWLEAKHISCWGILQKQLLTCSRQLILLEIVPRCYLTMRWWNGSDKFSYQFQYLSLHSEIRKFRLYIRPECSETKFIKITKNIQRWIKPYGKDIQIDRTFDFLSNVSLSLGRVWFSSIKANWSGEDQESIVHVISWGRFRVRRRGEAHVC